MLERVAQAYDRMVSVFAPKRAMENLVAREQFALLQQYTSGGYEAADTTTREMAGWTPYGTDADSSMLGLEDMRSRSRDAYRNQPVAGGLVNTTVMNTVGTGLTLQSRIDRAVLGLTDEEAEKAQATIERRFWLWAENKDCDLERRMIFNGHVTLALKSRFINGEHLALLPQVPVPMLSNPVRIQAIEADRLRNPSGTQDRPTLVNGVEKDQYGAPTAYHIMRSHPGNVLYSDSSAWQWDRYPARNEATGLPNVIHYFRTDRPGQTRGLPELAPLIEPLKDINRMDKAELKRAVVSALFTAFITSDTGGGLGNTPPAMVQNHSGGMTVTSRQPAQSAATTGNMQLGYGSIIGLTHGQDVKFASSGMPNPNYAGFWDAYITQISMRFGLPYQVALKKYDQSYSAAKASFDDAYRFFVVIRSELAVDFCDPIYAVWFAQEVAQGTIYAPGFFTDPELRAAWLGHEWIGPAKPVIDEVKAVEAAEARVSLGITTLAQETAAITGGDWETNHPQRVREERMRRDGGLIREKDQTAAPAPKPQPTDQNYEDQAL